MELFTQIDDAHAIIRFTNGVEKQVKLFRRNNRVYVPHSGGFVEVRSIHSRQQPLPLSTSHTSIRVLAYECAEVEIEDRYLRWTGRKAR